MAVLTLLLWVVSVCLGQNFGYGVWQNEVGVGYFCGALFSLLGVVVRKTVEGNLHQIISPDNVVLAVVDVLPFLFMLPLACLVLYAEFSGSVGFLFSFSSWVSCGLFSVFVWPLVDKLSK